MTRFEVPRADFAILTFLVGVTGIAVGLGAMLYWLMLPTVIPNGALAAPKRAPASYLQELTALSPVADMERAAREVAKEENAELGLQTPVAVADVTPPAPELPKARTREAKQTQKPARPKRVLHAQRRAPEPWAWGFAQRPFGGGFWFQ
jgi:hypothetical protein